MGGHVHTWLSERWREREGGIRDRLREKWEGPVEEWRGEKVSERVKERQGAVERGREGE